MSERSFSKTLLALLLCVSTLFPAATSDAQVMQSASYQIQSDSINTGGGYSSSTNYQQESTVGEIATGRGTSASYNLYAGYQQMQRVYISLTGASDVVMDNDIGGITGGTSNGSTTVTVITDSPGGYQLTVESLTSPAMQKGADTIADYAPAGAAPDLVFSTSPSDAHFAFSPFGVDTAQRFTTNGSVCDTSGTASSTACWDGLSTSPVVVATDNNSNHPSGATTTIFFKVGIGSSANQAPGIYTATTTITAMPL